MAQSVKKSRVRASKPPKKHPHDRPPRRWTSYGHKPKRQKP